MLETVSICHQGLVRENNEDSLHCDEQNGIFLVADGVGGHAGGSLASEIAVQVTEQKLRQGRLLKEAVLEADRAICQSAQQSGLEGMATTLVAARIQEQELELAWVGDSRAYLINGSGIQLLSEDHNLAGMLLRSGEISRQEWFDHPGQHELTQALGNLSLSDIPAKQFELQADDILLLCTDGLSGVLKEDEILSIISSARTLKLASKALLSRVLEAGAPDNITFVIAKQKSSAINAPLDSTKRTSGSHNTGWLTWFVLASIAFVLMLILII